MFKPNIVTGKSTPVYDGIAALKGRNFSSFYKTAVLLTNKRFRWIKFFLLVPLTF